MSVEAMKAALEVLEGIGLKTEKMVDAIAALRKAIEQENKISTWMMDKGYATGHGTSVGDLLQELEWQAAEREREACAKVAECYEPTCDSCPGGVAIAIRSRGIDGARVGEVGIWGEENPHDHVDTVTKSTNPMQNPHKHKENT